MTDVKISSRYLPNVSPREASDQMREYLRSELDLIALTLNAALDEIDALKERIILLEQ